jgi:hypothetical protein
MVLSAEQIHLVPAKINIDQLFITSFGGISTDCFFVMFYNYPFNDEEKHLHHISKFISRKTLDVFETISKDLEARKSGNRC